MITPSDIVTHLRAYLPVFTDQFSSTIVGSATTTGNTVTVASTAHGLTVGKQVIVAAGRFTNLVTSATDNLDGTVRFQTVSDHDLTEPRFVLDEPALELAGFPESPWNGTFKIVSIPNRRHFEVEFPTGVTTLPTLGTGYLNEVRRAGIVGLQTVATVPNANSFTFQAQDVPDLPNGMVNDLQILKGLYVYGAATFDRAKESYARISKNVGAKPALFVVMLDADVSKDRHTENDGTAAFVRGNLGKLIILQRFATIVFFPTDNSVTGHHAQNLCYSEIYRALTNVLYGFEFPDPDTAQRFVTVSNGHGPGDIDPALYAHVYEWEVPLVLTFENGFNLGPDVAFRDIYSDWALHGDSAANMALTVDLDDEPLP